MGERRVLGMSAAKILILGSRGTALVWRAADRSRSASMRYSTSERDKAVLRAAQRKKAIIRRATLGQYLRIFKWTSH
jgi:hypothetical protein